MKYKQDNYVFIMMSKVQSYSYQRVWFYPEDYNKEYSLTKSPVNVQQYLLTYGIYNEQVGK